MSAEPHHAEIRFLNRKHLAQHLLADVGEGGLLWVTDQTVRAGEIITVTIRMVGFSDTFTLRASVVWRHARPPGRDDLEEGVGLEFLPEEEEKIQELLQLTRESPGGGDELSADDRDEKRYAVNFLMEYLQQQELVQAPVTNISESGIYLQTRKFLVPQTRFVFFLKESVGSQPRVMEGQVVWVNREGDRAGMGVQFIFDSRPHRREIRDFVRALGDRSDR